jgi:hypothetical protein
MPNETTNLKLPEIVTAQYSKEITHNAGLAMLDALVQTGVADRHLTAPPVSPAEGGVWIPASVATGAWAAHENHLAHYHNAAWAFYAPAEGWRVWVRDEDVTLVWSGAAWQAHVLDGADHTISGKTPGHVMTALTAATHGFAAPVDEKAKVSADDTTPGYLEGKLNVIGGATQVTNNPAGNEVRTIAVHAQIHTPEDHVPKPTPFLYTANNLIPDSCFEVDNNGDGLADFWVYALGGQGTAILRTGDAVAGLRCLEFGGRTGTGTMDVKARPWMLPCGAYSWDILIPIDRTKTYSWGIWTKRVNAVLAGNSIQYYVEELDINGNWIGAIALAIITPDTAWAEATGTVGPATFNATTRSVHICIRDQSGNVGATNRVDAVRFYL